MERPPPGGSTSRRRALATAGSLAVTGALAGCLGGRGTAVSLLSAGSLASTFERHVGPAFERETGIDLRGEYHGTNAALRLIEDRTKRPDVVVSADATLLRDRLYGGFTDWDLEFASNSVGVCYDEATAFGRGLAEGEPWHELAVGSEPGALSIGDPDLDPLGYRAVQAFELAGREYDRPGLGESLLERVHREPDEPRIVAGVESGARAAAIVYRNMAVDHGVPFEAFPPAYNFADRALADHYATATYTTDEGHTVEGRPVVYNATVLDDAAEPTAGRRLVRFLGEHPGLLDDAGLIVGGDVPRTAGSAPEGMP